MERQLIFAEGLPLDPTDFPGGEPDMKWTKKEKLGYGTSD